MAKSFTLDGKRYKLDPVVPIGQIKWRMGHVHVGTSDEDVKSEWQKRCEQNGVTDQRIINQICHYALKCHRDNQNLYNFVQRPYR